jgi:hypothetical protein
MPLYRCDWPNGEVSIVLARSRRDAVDTLDELGGASLDMLDEIDDFMVTIARELIGKAPADEDDDPQESRLVTRQVSEATWDAFLSELRGCDEACACACHTEVEEPGPHLPTCKYADPEFEP